MSRRRASIPARYFEKLYAANPDPWSFRNSDYEREKYAQTLAALPHSRYAAAFEAGCSLGILTRALAPRCDSLLAVDAAEQPLAAARARCADYPQVRIERRRIPAEWPSGDFDLILLSEVLYYFDRADLAAVCSSLRQTLAPAGDVVLVHWIGETDYPLSGDDAVDGFIAGVLDIVRVLRRERHDRYRLDVLRRQ